jgi:hypothetical protein
MHREVTFTPTLEDHVAGQRLWLANYVRKLWMTLFLLLLAFVELATLASIAYDVAGGVPLSASLPDQAVPLICPLVILGVMFWNWHGIPGKVRRMAEQQPSLLSETEWRWNDEELIAQSAAGTSRIEWGSLYRWLSNEETIALMPQERMLLMLPRRALSAEQATDLISTLERFAVRARRS